MVLEKVVIEEVKILYYYKLSPLENRINPEI